MYPLLCVHDKVLGSLCVEGIIRNLPLKEDKPLCKKWLSFTYFTSDMKKPDGTLQVFEFDFSKDSPCYVTDFMWDNI